MRRSAFEIDEVVMTEVLAVTFVRIVTPPIFTDGPGATMAVCNAMTGVVRGGKS